MFVDIDQSNPTYGAFSLASGWPIFTALHMRTLPAWLEWGAAALTIGISLELIDAMAGWLARREDVHGEKVPGLAATPGPAAGRVLDPASASVYSETSA